MIYYFQIAQFTGNNNDDNNPIPATGWTGIGRLVP